MNNISKDKYKKTRNENFLIKLNKELESKTNNRLTHYDIKYQGKTFRSSWEVIFYYFNRSFLYESLRIPYFDTKTNKKRIYIVDFICHKEKIVIEIKPKELIRETELCKIKALNIWCKENRYKMKILTNSKIKALAKNITDFSDFDDITKNKILKI